MDPPNILLSAKLVLTLTVIVFEEIEAPPLAVAVKLISAVLKFCTSFPIVLSRLVPLIGATRLVIVG